MTLSRQISAGRYFGVAAILAIVLSASTSEAGGKRFTTGMVEVPEGSGIRIYLHNTCHEGRDLLRHDRGARGSTVCANDLLESVSVVDRGPLSYGVLPIISPET